MGQAAALARLGRALADPTRVQLLMALRDAPGYPAELAERLEITRQNLSNHLAVLRSSGLVIVAPEGRRSRYRLAVPAAADVLAALLDTLLNVEASRGSSPSSRSDP
ncbi:Transcriptional regulator, ArsR family [Modestobacter italicus]|uniref:Transcriptional regulator, ArsR family n=1 Tax=Modestobacter italicus (strain DSM 44449 / CECT 9708 / BC 501) TaxID=2732864 RepID=I4EUM1_MODI5|nr:metalloregulator ArsR/SmtB family transcription factor [Modestobacter marinus]CCH87084.1 Transcriptional regulator, ArsR family [Modestobacter marinus]